MHAIEFFLTTCGPCNQNLPIVSQLSQEIAKTTTTRLVALDRSEDLITAFVRAHKDLITMPVVLDTSHVSVRKDGYGVDGVPMFFVLGENDKVIFKSLGVLSDAEVKFIKTMVAN